MDRFTNKLVWILEKIVTVMIASAVAIILLQVFMRYVVSRPLSWSEQIARYLFIWMMMLGIPIMFHKKMYMAFDLVLDAMPEKLRNVMEIIIKIAICLFSVFFFQHSLELCIKTWGRMTAGVKIPLYCIYLAQPVSALCILIVTANQTFRAFAVKRTGGGALC